MGSPPAEDSRSYPFNFTISGSRQTVLRGLWAWAELGLLTPEQVRSIAEAYQLDQPGELAAGEQSSTPAALSTRGIPSGALVLAGIGPAYVLWGLALFGICGIHRFYLGRWRTGLLWLCTFGLLGIGQVIDLVLIPRMVQKKNAARQGTHSTPPSKDYVLLSRTAAQPSQEEATPQAGGEPETRTSGASPPVPVASLPPSWAGRMLQNLLAELSVRWLLVLGLFLVVVSSGVLAGSQWEQFSPTGQYAVLLAYTAAFGAGAWWAHQQEGLRLTGQTLEAIALLLLPVNVWALDGLNIAWGIRGVALGLLVGIPLAAWGRVRASGSGAGYAFYSTLMNFLALSGLHVLWGLGPLGITYLGIVSTVVYTWSRRSLALRGSKLWLLGAAGSLLVLRGLLSGQMQVSQLGLAVALLGWLMGEWQEPGSLPAEEVESIESSVPVSGPEALSRIPSSASVETGTPWASTGPALPSWVSQDWGRAGLVLLVLGGLLAWSGLSDPGAIPAAESPSIRSAVANDWQLLGISLLGIHFLVRRLSHRKQVVDLALLFLLGLETIWVFWQVLPGSWQLGVLDRLAGWFGPIFFPWGVLGLALLPYEGLWLGLAARWQQRTQDGEPGFSVLVRPTEGLVLGLGGSLLLLSLPNLAIRFWHLLLGTGILAGWLWYQSKFRTAAEEEGVEDSEPSLAQRPFWVFLTHAYGVAALLAGIHWLLPELEGSSWGVILLVLALLEWAGGVALYRWPVGQGSSRTRAGGPWLQVWQQSAGWLGLVLALASYGNFFIQRFHFLGSFLGYWLPDRVSGTESIELDFHGWLWLGVPLTLTVAQVLAWPSLEFMPLWLQSRQRAGGLSWRQGIPARESFGSLTLASILMSQLLTLGVPGSSLWGLGLGAFLIATQVWLFARLPIALLTVTFGLGFGIEAINQAFPALTEQEWLAALSALLLLLSGCRYGVKHLSTRTPSRCCERLQESYRSALDGLGTLLGLVLLLAITTTLFTPPYQTVTGALPLATGGILLAIGLRLWVEVTPALGIPRTESLPTSQDRDTEEGERGDAIPPREVLDVEPISLDGLLYGLGWALELLVISAVLWRWPGSPPIVPEILSLVATINLGLGILFWIGPERTVFLKAWGQPWRRLTSFWAGPLIYGFLGWLGSHLEWDELTGLGSLGFSIILLGLGRRQQWPQRRFHLGVLGALGVSLAAYESWIYFLSQQSGGSLGDGLVLISLLGLVLALAYRLCPRWIADYLYLPTSAAPWRSWLGRIGYLNWGLASLGLLPALLDLSALGEILWLLTGSGLAAYAAWQGRKLGALLVFNSDTLGLRPADATPEPSSHPATPENEVNSPKTLSEAAWVQCFWSYLSALQWAGILAVAVYLWLPVDLGIWGGSLACGLGLVYYFLPWQRWGWWPDPWQNTALVLPITVMLLTASETNSSNLLLGAVYYAFLSIAPRGHWREQRSQVRLGYVSLFLSNWILLDYGWQQEWSSLTLYALPLVGSLLYVAQVDPGLQQASARQSRHGLRSFSSGLLVLVTLIETHGQLWAGFWPVGLGLALGLLGLALRVRAYLFMGTLSFGLGVLRQGWLLVTAYSLLLWGIGILLGLLLIWVAANFEQRREQLRAWLDSWLGQLQSWE
ncbi:TM2 domain-containing protein [Synechococcus sp. Nb3U1]|uniref:TM2 domain-containing protein n=1 Tax=Synechococcus sp. Nb3U1 TaxID=1914529 RepID=UPI001F2B61AC|nr:TM2 domain-containing protein [Synechococcus sp. Nb3U1]MCF2969766.1 TM2 domain-containing protein [Synechococcus sp. Nb3U1]